MKFIHPPFSVFVQADCVPDGHVVEGLDLGEATISVEEDGQEG